MTRKDVYNIIRGIQQKLVKTTDSIMERRGKLTPEIILSLTEKELLDIESEIFKELDKLVKEQPKKEE